MTEDGGASTRLSATAAFAAEVLGRPEADGMHCLAILYGLRGEASLAPWLAGGVTDVEELARRDYEPEHGDGWREEWQHQIREAEAVIEGRVGPDWRDVLRARIAAAEASDNADFRK